jgi:hypothetical protein
VLPLEKFLLLRGAGFHLADLAPRLAGALAEKCDEGVAITLRRRGVAATFT